MRVYRNYDRYMRDLEAHREECRVRARRRRRWIPSPDLVRGGCAGAAGVAWFHGEFVGFGVFVIAVALVIGWVFKDNEWRRRAPGLTEEKHA